jgi:hypothetical protein
MRAVTSKVSSGTGLATSASPVAFSPAVRVAGFACQLLGHGSSELLGGTKSNVKRNQLGVAECDVAVKLMEDGQHHGARLMDAIATLNGDVFTRL